MLILVSGAVETSLAHAPAAGEPLGSALRHHLLEPHHLVLTLIVAVLLYALVRIRTARRAESSADKHQESAP